MRRVIKTTVGVIEIERFSILESCLGRPTWSRRTLLTIAHATEVYYIFTSVAHASYIDTYIQTQTNRCKTVIKIGDENA
jgi:hypothetical protein